MPKVTLAKSIRLPGDRLRRIGESIEVSDEVFAQFADQGVFDSDKPAPVPVGEKPAQVTDAVPVSDAPVKDNEAPKRTAPLSVWQKYVEAQGIETKGLSKKDLIAATS